MPEPADPRGGERECLACGFAHEARRLYDVEVSLNGRAGPWVAAATTYCEARATAVIAIDGLAVLWPDGSGKVPRPVETVSGEGHRRAVTAWRTDSPMVAGYFGVIEGPTVLHLRRA